MPQTTNTPNFTDPAQWLKQQTPSAPARKTPLERLTTFAEDRGLTITSTTGGQHNPGSKHPTGEAIDFRTKDQTPAYVEEVFRQAESLGYRVRDERQRPPGQQVWGGPHGHLEYTPEVEQFDKFGDPGEWLTKQESSQQFTAPDQWLQQQPKAETPQVIDLRDGESSVAGLNQGRITPTGEFILQAPEVKASEGENVKGPNRGIPALDSTSVGAASYGQMLKQGMSPLSDFQKAHAGPNRQLSVSITGKPGAYPDAADISAAVLRSLNAPQGFKEANYPGRDGVFRSGIVTPQFLQQLEQAGKLSFDPTSGQYQLQVEVPEEVYARMQNFQQGRPLESLDNVGLTEAARWLAASIQEDDPSRKNALYALRHLSPVGGLDASPNVNAALESVGMGIGQTALNAGKLVTGQMPSTPAEEGSQLATLENALQRGGRDLQMVNEVLDPSTLSKIERGLLTGAFTMPQILSMVEAGGMPALLANNILQRAHQPAEDQIKALLTDIATFKAGNIAANALKGGGVTANGFGQAERNVLPVIGEALTGGATQIFGDVASGQAKNLSDVIASGVTGAAMTIPNAPRPGEKLTTLGDVRPQYDAAGRLILPSSDIPVAATAPANPFYSGLEAQNRRPIDSPVYDLGTSYPDPEHPEALRLLRTPTETIASPVATTPEPSAPSVKRRVPSPKEVRTDVSVDDLLAKRLKTKTGTMLEQVRQRYSPEPAAAEAPPLPKLPTAERAGVVISETKPVREISAISPEPRPPTTDNPSPVTGNLPPKSDPLQMIEAKGPSPDRTQSVQFGMWGDVRVDHPDVLHKELFNLRGSKPEQAAAVAERLGISQRDVWKLADEYQKTVKEGAREVARAQNAKNLRGDVYDARPNAVLSSDANGRLTPRPDLGVKVKQSPDEIELARYQQQKRFETVREQVRQAAPKGEYGQLANLARKSITDDQGNRQPAVAAHPEWKRHLDLAPDASHDATLNAIAQDLGGKRRASQLSPADWHRIEEIHGQDWSDSLRQTVAETLSRHEAQHQKWEKFADDADVQRILGNEIPRGKMAATVRELVKLAEKYNDKDTSTNIAKSRIEALSKEQSRRRAESVRTEDSQTRTPRPDGARAETQHQEARQDDQSQPNARRSEASDRGTASDGSETSRGSGTERLESQSDPQRTQQDEQSVERTIAHQRPGLDGAKVVAQTDKHFVVEKADGTQTLVKADSSHLKESSESAASRPSQEPAKPKSVADAEYVSHPSIAKGEPLRVLRRHQGYYLLELPDGTQRSIHAESVVGKALKVAAGPLAGEGSSAYAAKPGGRYERRTNAEPKAGKLSRDILRDFRDGEDAELSSANGKLLDRGQDDPESLSAKLGGSGSRLRGLAFRTLERTGRVDLRGQVVESAHDLAQLAQVYRDPRIETFRIIYTKGKQIVAHEGVTSRMPDSAAAFDTNEARGFYRMQARMERLGADGYYLLHNHPSGKPQPSRHDVLNTYAFAREVKGFQGHIVINSGEYAVIGKNLTAPTRHQLPQHVETLLKASIPHDFLNQKINNERDVVKLGKALQSPEGFISLAYLDAHNQVRALQEIPVALFQREKEASDFLRGRKREFGAVRVVSYAETDPLLLPSAQALIRNGSLYDHVSSSGVAERPVDLPETRQRAKGIRVEEDSAPYQRTVPPIPKKRGEGEKTTLPADFNPLAFVEEAQALLDKQKSFSPKRDAKAEQYLEDALAAIEANDADAFAKAKRGMEVAIASTLSDKFLTLVRAGLLTSPRTHARNMLGNTAYAAMDSLATVPGAIVDASLSAITGRRSYTATMAKGSLDGAAEGWKEARQVMRRGATDKDLAKFEMHGGFDPNSIAGKYTDFVFNTLTAEDRLFKGIAYNRSIENQAKAIALTEARGQKMSSAEIKKRTKELTANPTLDMQTQGLLDADIQTFNSPSKLADKYQEVVSASPAPVRIGAGLLVPFLRTPTNVLARMFEASPVGILKNIQQAINAVATARNAQKEAKWNGIDESFAQAIKETFTPAQQREFAQTFGRASVGTAILLTGYMLGKAGMMTGLRDDDDMKELSKRAADRAVGRPEGAIKIGGKWHQVTQLAPGGNLLAIGATLAREGVGDALNLVGDVAMDQPFAHGFKELMDLRSKEKAGERFIASKIGMVVPSIAADVATALDTKERKAEGVLGQLQKRTPIWRNSLPETKDVLGQDVEFSRTNAINPFNSKTAKEDSNPVLAEIARLNMGISSQRARDGETPEQLATRIKASGDDFLKRANEFVQSAKYQSYTDEQKKEAINEVLKVARAEEAKKLPKVKKVPKPKLYQ